MNADIIHREALYIAVTTERLRQAVAQRDRSERRKRCHALLSAATRLEAKRR